MFKGLFTYNKCRMNTYFYQPYYYQKLRKRQIHFKWERHYNLRIIGV